MTVPALLLVLTAALIHASWNLLAKQAADALAFLWGAMLASSILFAPIALWLGLLQPIPPHGWGIVLLTSLFETAYFWFLGHAYRSGDLSLVYPVIRGISPLVTPVLGVLLLGERLSASAVLGIVLVVSGILVAHLTGFNWATVSRLARALEAPATRYALASGICTAAYSIIDKVGVSVVLVPLYTYLLYLGATIGVGCLLLPRHSRAVVAEWRRNSSRVLVVGILGPLTYGLVLWALTFTPVSYVAPAREVSVVIAALLGAMVLGEAYGVQRITGSVLIGSGVIFLAAG